jgi:hypothetical protein
LLFNFGSALVDILTASVWNRVMITDLARHRLDLAGAALLAGATVDLGRIPIRH